MRPYSMNCIVHVQLDGEIHLAKEKSHAATSVEDHTVHQACKHDARQCICVSVEIIIVYSKSQCISKVFEHVCSP